MDHLYKVPAVCVARKVIPDGHERKLPRNGSTNPIDFGFPSHTSGNASTRPPSLYSGCPYTTPWSAPPLEKYEPVHVVKFSGTEYAPTPVSVTAATSTP